jgi:hypothetical protein
LFCAGVAHALTVKVRKDVRQRIRSAKTTTQFVIANIIISKLFCYIKTAQAGFALFVAAISIARLHLLQIKPYLTSLRDKNVIASACFSREALSRQNNEIASLTAFARNDESGLSCLSQYPITKRKHKAALRRLPLFQNFFAISSPRRRASRFG